MTNHSIHINHSIHFTATQLATLQALVDVIVPPDDFPGAWDAGVGDYLAGQFMRDLAPMLPLYRSGLDALEAESVTCYGRSFADLDDVQRIDLFSSLEKGVVVTPWPVAPVRFVHLAVNHTMEGYYGDPGNGGNRNTVSWQMIGFKVTI